MQNVFLVNHEATQWFIGELNELIFLNVCLFKCIKRQIGAIRFTKVNQNNHLHRLPLKEMQGSAEKAGKFVCINVHVNVQNAKNMRRYSTHTMFYLLEKLLTFVHVNQRN